MQGVTFQRKSGYFRPNNVSGNRYVLNHSKMRQIAFPEIVTMLPGLIAQCFSVSGYIQPITVELDCLVRELTGLQVPITGYSCQNMWLKSWYSADLCDDHGSWVNVGGEMQGAPVGLQASWNFVCSMYR